jgi:hypothetical protein
MGPQDGEDSGAGSWVLGWMHIRIGWMCMQLVVVI